MNIDFSMISKKHVRNASPFKIQARGTGTTGTHQSETYCVRTVMSPFCVYSNQNSPLSVFV